MIEGLNIPRVLDLSKKEDQLALVEAAKEQHDLLDLVENNIFDLERFFPEPAWRKVYSGGLVAIPTTEKHSEALDVRELFLLVQKLKGLEKYPGFDKLLLGFKNPTQVTSTIFEATVGDWCATRSISESIEFSPEVKIAEKKKYPDFLWCTELGNLYCECKQANMLEHKFWKRLSRLYEALSLSYKSHEPWNLSFCLDIFIKSNAKNGVENRISNVVQKASLSLGKDEFDDKTFEEGEVRGTLRRKGVPRFSEKESICQGQIIARTGPTKVDLDENADFTLTMPLSGHREKAAAHLLREARTQLPTNQPGAVFIKLGGIEAAHRKLLNLLGQPQYVNTPWVSVWSLGEMRPVWRNGQPFDARIVAPMQNSIPGKLWRFIRRQFRHLFYHSSSK